MVTRAGRIARAPGLGLLALACVLAAPALVAPLRADAVGEPTRLLDWYYPSEAPYQALLAAVRTRDKQGWLRERLDQGKPVPQATAREWAMDLAADAALPQDQRDRLLALFMDEPDCFGIPKDLPEVNDLEQAFGRLNAQLSALETSNKTNLYNGVSRPSFSAVLNAAYMGGGASGLLVGQQFNNLIGGWSTNWSGVDKGVTYTFGLNLVYYQPGPDQPILPETVIGNTMAVQVGAQTAAFNVQVGRGLSIQTSALVGGSPEGNGASNPFYIDLTNNSAQPAYTVTPLTLGLPYGAVSLYDAVTLRGSVPTAWWPFSDTLFFFNQPQDLVQTYNNKAAEYGGGLRFDTRPWFNAMENNDFRLALTGYGNDGDELNAYGLGPGNTINDIMSVGELDTALGWDGSLRSGFTWAAEYGVSTSNMDDPDYVFNDSGTSSAPSGAPNTSNLSGYHGGTVRGLDRHFEDEAWVADLTEPVGPLNLGLEYSDIGPLFDAGGSISTSGFSDGAVSNFIVDGPLGQGPSYSPNSALTPWLGAPPPGGTVGAGGVSSSNNLSDIAWGTDISNPSELEANTRKFVLKSQGAWEWISGTVFYSGASQIEASGPWVKTSPFLESGNGGDMLYDRFGGTFYVPPAPGSAAPSAQNGTADNPYTTSADYEQWGFNSPTDGTAVSNNGESSQPVHWQELAQTTYNRLDFYTLMSRHGVGDNVLMDDSQKDINDAVANLSFDLKSLFHRSLPATLQMGAELRDAAPQLELPRLDPGNPSTDPDASFFTQAMARGFFRWSVNRSLSLLVTGDCEDWQSLHGYQPLMVQIKEGGVGADLDMQRYLSYLTFFWRSRELYLQDMNFGSRDFSVWENDIGTNLSF